MFKNQDLLPLKRYIFDELIYRGWENKKIKLDMYKFTEHFLDNELLFAISDLGYIAGKTSEPDVYEVQAFRRHDELRNKINFAKYIEKLIEEKGFDDVGCLYIGKDTIKKDLGKNFYLTDFDMVEVVWALGYDADFPDDFDTLMITNFRIKRKNPFNLNWMWGI